VRQHARRYVVLSSKGPILCYQLPGLTSVRDRSLQFDTLAQSRKKANLL
jgi:hypothetical protein